MTSGELDRFRHIEILFTGALDHPRAERAAWLWAECAHDTTLVTEVLQLLQYDEQVTAVVPSLPGALPSFGPWQAVRLLGRGGMGVVYLAERADGAFQMKTAVKVVPLALASFDIEERFRRERQFLASLDHPKIARLIDGGVTSTGLPYLVMEFVDGLNIGHYCDAWQLPERSRIELMRQVLEALTYVHGRQVIHRDIKPSNILVDYAGNVKLLDFGTARLVDASGDTELTKTGVFAFTPEYASPEQVQGKAVTYASDIYSAGALLSRLLTGETKPETSGLAAPLAAILSKATHTDPEERYASASEMDADLARYLAGQPVLAQRLVKRLKWKWSVLAAALLLGAAVTNWFLQRKVAPLPPDSIAVLPFANVGGNSADQYFSDGLTDELTDSLARRKNLRVIARSSAYQFKGKSVDVREIGRLLNVASILEGSVEHLGGRIRVVAHLERAADGSHLWSQTFERSASDLFALQGDLVAGVETSLKASVRSPAPNHVPSAAAHEAAMRGRYDMQQFTPDSLARAENEYQQAVDLDPEYASAYAGLGTSKYNHSAVGGSTSQSDADLKAAQRLFRKALSIDPNLPGVHANLAIIDLQYAWEWKDAESELQLATEGVTDATAENFYATLLVCRGRFPEADRHIERLLELAPYSISTLVNVSLDRASEGRYSEALEFAQRAAAVTPLALAPQQLIVLAFIEEGHPELALPVAEKLKTRLPAAAVFEAMAYAKSGQREAALSLIRPYEEKYPNPGVPAMWIASVYAFMSDEANTVKWLGRSADRHEYQILGIGVNPTFATVRDSAGFRALEKRIGLD